MNSDTTDTSPTLSPDGLTLVFASNRVGGQGKRDLFVARYEQVWAWLQAKALTAKQTTEFLEKMMEGIAPQ